MVEKKSKQWLPLGGRGWGLIKGGTKGTSWSNGDVLYWDSGLSYTGICIYQSL